MLSNSSKEALRRTEEIAGATFPLYAEAYNLLLVRVRRY